jgi:hypothetical protein
MNQLKEFRNYKRHLINRYNMLIEKSNNYMFVDETISDVSAFKAMKLQEKINQVRFLDREVTN